MQSILLIDDDEDLRVALCLFLERAGYTVTVARDGREGLKIFRRLPPDLVITDIVMDGLEGIETSQALCHEVPGVKIIAMSGGGSRRHSSFLEFAKHLGAQQTLDKPFHPKDLLTAVCAALHQEASQPG
jgi:DNA-binding response OmpR family regulator